MAFCSGCYINSLERPCACMVGCHFSVWLFTITIWWVSSNHWTLFSYSYRSRRSGIKSLWWVTLFMMTLGSVSCTVVSHSLQSHGLYSLPSSSFHGFFQGRILEWVAIPFSRGYFQPRNQAWISCTAGRFFTIWVTRKAQADSRENHSLFLGAFRRFHLHISHPSLCISLCPLLFI